MIIRTKVTSMIAGASLAIAGLPVPAAAHHSFNMFDSGKTVTLDASVKTFRWSMPHVWITVVAAGPQGAAQEWGMECHSPNIIARKGWNSATVKPGDHVKVTMHPMRDGSAAGSVIYITLTNGKKLWNAESETSQ